MKFSAQEEYGLRCLLQIAKAGDGASLAIPQISRLEGLSQANVAKLMRLLRKGGFVVASRGQSGGYALGRRPREIAVGEVLAFLGGRLYDAGFCDRHKGTALMCTNSINCSIRSLWSSLQFAVDDVVNKMTLDDLLPKPVTAALEYAR